MSYVDYIRITDDEQNEIEMQLCSLDMPLYREYMFWRRINEPVFLEAFGPHGPGPGSRISSWWWHIQHIFLHQILPALTYEPRCPSCNGDSIWLDEDCQSAECMGCHEELYFLTWHGGMLVMTYDQLKDWVSVHEAGDKGFVEMVMNDNPVISDVLQSDMSFMD